MTQTVTHTGVVVTVKEHPGIDSPDAVYFNYPLGGYGSFP